MRRAIDPIVVETVADGNWTATAVFAGTGDPAALVGAYDVVVTCGDELTTSFTVTAVPVPAQTSGGSLASIRGDLAAGPLRAGLCALLAGAGLFVVHMVRARMR